jgi:glycosyltransferase involved in cell wall biosynthesis
VNTPVASVVIAAHNEENVIARCIAVLTSDAAPGEIEVVVVANACSDRTAEVAKAAGARVIETPIAGKAHALVLGDRDCMVFPRAYLDADVELDTDSLRVLARAVGTGRILVCSPVPRFDLTAVSWAAARFHRTVDLLVGGRRGLTGAGIYLLSEQAHERVFPLPEVTSDDGFVHRSFTGDERTQVSGAHSVVRPARTLGAVIRRRARVRLGNRELDALGTPTAEAALRPGDLAGLVRRREVRPMDGALFLGVLSAERQLAYWRRRSGRAAIWSLDRTSRT